ncbi:hypothetical protein ACIQBJ_08185 [Kitasatospora sp. NPDC088391]
MPCWLCLGVLVLAQYRARQATGESAGLPHEKVRAQLGLGPTA